MIFVQVSMIMKSLLGLRRFEGFHFCAVSNSLGGVDERCMEHGQILRAAASWQSLADSTRSLELTSEAENPSFPGGGSQVLAVLGYKQIPWDHGKAAFS